MAKFRARLKATASLTPKRLHWEDILFLVVFGALFAALAIACFVFASQVGLEDASAGLVLGLSSLAGLYFVLHEEDIHVRVLRMFWHPNN